MQLNLAEFELGVSEFVELVNQTFEYAISSVVITGELANLRVSKNKWVYFDLKDEGSSVKFFGTVYMLPGPLEDGMLLRVRGQPKLHNLYGFSVNVMSMQPAGEGSIKRAAQLLQLQLEKEGLFDAGRKRPLPYPPRRIGLITSKQSAAYADFIKILKARWQGLEIELIDVQVQGEIAPAQITAALEQFNEEAEPPDVLVMIRGGGSPEDLAAFSTEQVTRAVAASRVPTLVAIGHEIDTSLAELAADMRASTPSNAAELLVPDRGQVLASLPQLMAQLGQSTRHHIRNAQRDIRDTADTLSFAMNDLLAARENALRTQEQLLAALSPQAILRRGYAVVRHGNQPVRDVANLTPGDIVEVQLASGLIRASTEAVTKKEAENDKR